MSQSPPWRLVVPAIVVAVAVGLAWLAFGSDRDRVGAARAAEGTLAPTSAHLGSERAHTPVERAAEPATGSPRSSDEVSGEVTGKLSLRWVGTELSRWKPETTLISSIRAEDPSVDRRVRSQRKSSLTLRRLNATSLGIPCAEHLVSDVPPGRYWVELAPLGVRRSVLVEPGRTTRIDLDLPPLAHTTIVFLDAATGAPRLPHRAWILVKGESGTRVSSDPLGPGKDGELQFVSEPGQLFVDCDDPSLALAQVTSDRVDAGTNVINALVVPAAHLILEWDEAARGSDQPLVDAVELKGPDGRSARLGTRIPVNTESTRREVDYTIPSDTDVEVSVRAGAHCSAEVFHVRVGQGEAQRRRVECLH